MKRAIYLLTGLLLIQLLLVVGLRMSHETSAASTAGRKLLPLTQMQVSQLQINGPGQQSIILQKVADKWLLPDHFAAPADTQKVDKLLKTLLDIKRGWPVAKTGEAIRRFKLSDDNFERRLQFGTPDKTLATLLIGSSPGFRKVHARLANEQLVFDIPFSSYQASLKAADWVDRRLLQLKKEQIRAIVLPDCRLTQKDGTIRLADLAATEQTDAKKAGQLFNRLSRLQILDVVSKTAGKLPETDRLTISVELADGKTRQYQFARNRQDAFALLKVSDGAHIYKVSGALLKELQATTRQQLLQSAPPKPVASGS